MLSGELIQMIHIILYRLKRSTQNAHEDYFNFKAGNDTRSPFEILGHLVDVSYALRMLEVSELSNSENSALEKLDKNFNALRALLASNTIAEGMVKKLVNGPLSDTLTHIGRLAFLRRLGRHPLEWKNYTNANT